MQLQMRLCGCFGELSIDLNSTESAILTKNVLFQLFCVLKSLDYVEQCMQIVQKHVYVVFDILMD